MSILYTQCLASELAKPANQIVVMGTSVPTAAPVVPVRFFVNTATTPATLYYWTGTAWILVGDGVGSGGGGGGGGGGGTGVTFATAAEVIAGVAGGVALSPASLVTRESMPPQTGVSADVLAIPAPGPNQSMWAQNTLGETLHYAPGGGWKIVADRYILDTGEFHDLWTMENPSAIGVVVHTWIAPRNGTVSVTGQAIFHCPVSNFGVTAIAGFFANGAFLVWNSSPLVQHIDGAWINVSVTYEVAAGDVVNFCLRSGPGLSSVYSNGVRVVFAYVD